MHKQCPGRENWHSANTVPVLFLREEAACENDYPKTTVNFCEKGKRKTQHAAQRSRFAAAFSRTGTNLLLFCTKMRGARLLNLTKLRISTQFHLTFCTVCCILYA